MPAAMRQRLADWFFAVEGTVLGSENLPRELTGIRFLIAANPGVRRDENSPDVKHHDAGTGL
jgi:hypothetical protein